MVQFLSIIFFLGFLQFLLGFSKVPVFLRHLVLLNRQYGDSTLSRNAGNVYHTVRHYNSEDSHLKCSVLSPYNKFNENLLRRS